MMAKLTIRQRGDLESLKVKPGLWRRVSPDEADPELHQLIRFGLVKWMPGGGYELTAEGRALLDRRKTR